MIRPFQTDDLQLLVGLHDQATRRESGELRKKIDFFNGDRLGSSWRSRSARRIWRGRDRVSARRSVSGRQIQVLIHSWTLLPAVPKGVAWASEPSSVR
jgi:hypothetical protein